MQQKNVNLKSYPPTPLLTAAGINRDFLWNLARQTGVLQRASATIDLPLMLECLCNESVKGCVSYNDLAAQFEVLTAKTVSRQAFWERINSPSCVDFFEKVLASVVSRKLNVLKCKFFASANSFPFKRILIQDSTIIQLPAKLLSVFSGTRNASSKLCSARIQNVYDLCAGSFTSFSIDPYSKNDYWAADQIDAQCGDLVIRDRGYLIIDNLGDFKRKGIDAISRYKHPSKFFDLTGKRIDLLQLLSTHGTLDMIVYGGENKDVRLRLMAVPVSEEIASQRRKKIKKENHGHAPSGELLELMSWSIFLTTIEDPAMTIDFIIQLYELRWRIENIFKTWKSNFRFEKIHNVSENQLRVLLMARLIVITLAYHEAYVPLHVKICQNANRQLSLMKLMRYIQRNLHRLPQMLNPLAWTSALLTAIARYCTYDKRKRKNFIDNQIDIFSKLAALGALA